MVSQSLGKRTQVDVLRITLLQEWEQPMFFCQLFDLTDRAHRIYVKKPTAVRHPLFFPPTDYKGVAAFIAPRPGLHGPAVPEFQVAIVREWRRRRILMVLSSYAPLHSYSRAGSER